MESSDDINDYLPSLLNPRAQRKDNGNISLTQNSVLSRRSLSLKRCLGVSLSQVNKGLQKVNERKCKKEKIFAQNTATNMTVSKDLKSFKENSSDISFSAIEDIELAFKKENCQNVLNLSQTKCLPKNKSIDICSVGCSAFEDSNSLLIDNKSSPFSFDYVEVPQNDQVELKSNKSLISVSSATDLHGGVSVVSGTTVTYDIAEEQVVSVSFGVNNCDTVDLSTKNSNIKKVSISHMGNATNVDCEMVESSQISFESETDENMNDIVANAPKRSAVAVNLEIKKKRPSEDDTENSNVLILNTDDIRKLSHVIVQPPNYKLVKRQTLDLSKFKNSYKGKPIVKTSVKNGKIVRGDNLKQKSIDAYLSKHSTFVGLCSRTENVLCNDGKDMSKNAGVADAVKCDHLGKASLRTRRENELSARSIRLVARREDSPRRPGARGSSSDARRVPVSPFAPTRHDSAGSAHSPRRSFNVDSVQFTLSSKSKSIKTSPSPRNIPHYKIVAGTHFAVDAFSYGEIPNVKHYFLTHFHSDHYSGLKKSFSKILFCSKITADLCVSRLGVSPKCIHIINIDDTITVDGVEVTAVDANHCPGAIMLVFTLPSGKTLLHTGDCRASPLMESYPVFWNKDIHTVYLDTTYCNPRYDFPTQEQSLEMALYLLRQKKLALEKAGKKFSSVLIVCGTYTIGKEKFFLGMARRVGCAVWACPEKDRVLQAVEGRSFSHAPPHSCQLHVVPMRDLNYEKLRTYLESLQGAFTEVVAFKPSGWENGRGPAVEKDGVTIHGIPYSEHSSFSELLRIVKFLAPKQVVPTVDITGGVKSVQKHFPCPLVCKEDLQSQSRLTDYFSIQSRQQGTAVT